MHSSRVLRVLPRLASRPFAAARAATSASTLAAHPHAPFFSRTGRTGVLLACSGAARWFGAFPNHVLSSDSTPTIPLDIPPTLSQSQLDALPDTYLQYVSGYGYFPIPDPVASAELLRADLAAEGFKGRIYVSHEGINVQAACHPRDSQRLVELVRAADRGRFAGMRLFRNEIFDFAGKGAPFSKLVCKHRALINEGILPEFSEKISEHLDGYKHLPPAEWHEEMMRIHKAKAQARAEAGSKNADANALIFDVRNIYEYEIGSFAHAKPISVDSFSGTYPDLDRLLGLTGPNTASAHVDTVDGADPVLLAAKHTRSRQFSTDKTGKQVDAAQARLDFDATVLPTIDWDAVVVSPTDVETLLARARARASSGDYAAAAQDARAAADAAEVEAAPAAPAVPAPAGPVAKDTKIRMFCTGGIRCVKVGAYLAQQGFTDVAVLEGGVNAYAGYIRNIASGAAEAETAADGVTVDESVAPRASTPSPALSAASAASTFIGANVVFDERRSVRVTDHDLGRCHSCGAPCSLPNNCVQPRCNTLLLRCARCTAAYGGACSALCAFEFDGGVNVVGNIIEANKSEAHTCEDRAKHPITLRLYGPQTNRNRPRIAPITRPLDFA